MSKIEKAVNEGDSKYFRGGVGVNQAAFFAIQQEVAAVAAGFHNITC